MKKNLEKTRLEESQINLEIEERKLKTLLEKMKGVEGGEISKSKSETHFKVDSENSFSIRFNDKISSEESDGKIKVTWIKGELCPSLKINRQTEIVIIVGEQIENVMMKFNFENKNINEPYVFHDTPKINWWILISMLNRSIDECINS